MTVRPMVHDPAMSAISARNGPVRLRNRPIRSESRSDNPGRPAIHTPPPMGVMTDNVGGFAKTVITGLRPDYRENPLFYAPVCDGSPSLGIAS